MAAERKYWNFGFVLLIFLLPNGVIVLFSTVAAAVLPCGVGEKKMQICETTFRKTRISYAVTRIINFIQVHQTPSHIDIDHFPFYFIFSMRSQCILFSMQFDYSMLRSASTFILKTLARACVRRLLQQIQKPITLKLERRETKTEKKIKIGTRWKWAKREEKKNEKRTDEWMQKREAKHIQRDREKEKETCSWSTNRLLSLWLLMLLLLRGDA